MASERRVNPIAVMLVVIALLAMLGVVAWSLRAAVFGNGSPRNAAFSDIEDDVAGNTLVGLTEVQLRSRYGDAGKDANGIWTFRTGRKLGNPLEGPRRDELLLVRVRNGIVVEAGLERLPSQGGFPR